MNKNNIRLERINSELQKVIQSIIDTELRDPQINAIIGVTAVEVTPDIANAKVFISCMGTTQKEEVLARIKGAGSFIRGQVSKQIKLRITPRFDFRLDNSAEYSSKIDEILSKITYSTQLEEDDDKQ
ncbi:MAG: 30S ribosome-binding factor RbfA [Clostridia bacterium]|nr:30S ribosome-binding factor RbfA [Clostridia bacterium]